MRITKKTTQLTAALLLAALVNVSDAAEEVCFPPADGTDFSDVLQCMQDKDDAQQTQIDALKKENQRLTNKVTQLERHTLRYIDNGDGTVTDNRSGLTWLKNANCFGEQDWETAMQSAARLKSGQCGLHDGSTAGMWRLPTVYEWRIMVGKCYRNPALSNASGTAQWKGGRWASGR